MDHITRQGNLLVVPKNAQLPRRCVYCNCEVVTPPRRQKYYWSPPSILSLLSLPGLLIQGLMSKSGTVYISVCPEHMTRRRKRIGFGIMTILIAAGALVGGVAVAAESLSQNAAMIGPTLCVAGIIGVIIGSILISRSRLLSPTRIDAELLYLKGAGRPFLDSVPVGV